MRTALHALGFWLLLCAFGLLWALCGALEFIFRPRWPRRPRRDLAATFDPIRTLRR